jgi:hypothetical protein
MNEMTMKEGTVNDDEGYCSAYLRSEVVLKKMGKKDRKDTQNNDPYDGCTLLRQ